jgi:hypothetical protein
VAKMVVESLSPQLLQMKEELLRAVRAKDAKVDELRRLFKKSPLQDSLVEVMKRLELIVQGGVGASSSERAKQLIDVVSFFFFFRSFIFSLIERVFLKLFFKRRSNYRFIVFSTLSTFETLPAPLF